VAAAPAGVDRPDLVAIRKAWDAERHRLDGVSDPDAWEIAAEAWGSVQWPRWAVYAETRRAEAVAAVVGSSSDDRVAAFTRARDRATAIDSPLLLGEVVRLAGRAGVVLAGGTIAAAPGANAAPALGELTRREREVLDLVVEGATNRQIANRLFISEKTASVHVSRILTKLGATNRQEAAAVARRAAARSNRSPS
jgi:DNA-binding NarL/FixJ family response regulator